MDVTNFTEPRHLTASEDISGFDCGLPFVNDWLVSTHYVHTALSIRKLPVG